MVVVGKSKYLIGCIYRPNDMKDIDDLRRVFEVARSYVGNNGFKDIIIMGDFNFPEIKWSDGLVCDIITGDDSTAVKFSDILYDNFLIQHVNTPTFQLNKETVNNILD